MNQAANILPVNMPIESFKDFLLHSRRNRMALCMAGIAVVLEFAVFKYFYPYASYIHGDSFVYLEIAYKNLDIESYMVGYGRFLRLFSVLTSSDTILTAFQYLLLQSSILFLLFTIFYFYRPGRLVQWVLLGCMVLNPLLLHMGNLVSSDNLFLSLSMIWFTLLLWIIHRPGNRLLVWQAIVLFIAFTVRYNALLYPVIAAAVIWLCKLPLSRRIAGIGAGLLLCTLFVLYTGSKYKALTGTWQYAPFSGWLLSNNAMYAYRYVDSAKRKPVPKRFRDMDNMIRTYFDTTRDVKKHPENAMMASTVYMWSYGSPLSKYRDKLFKGDTISSELKKWASMGPLYKAYGMYIITHYPLQYIRYFLWPNANKYYAPPVEFLEAYNSGYDRVAPRAQQWFGYKSIKVTTRTKDRRVRMLNFYPVTSGIINVLMLCGLICFAMMGGFSRQSLFRSAVILGGGIWLLNAVFTIWASSAALRFQAFPILLSTIFSLLLLDWIWRTGAGEQQNTVRPAEVSESAAYTLPQAKETGTEINA